MKDYLEILEYKKIKENLLKYSINDLSTKMILDLHPHFFYEEIKEQLDRTNEGYKLSLLNNYPSLNMLVDESENLRLVAKNGVLSVESIYSFFVMMDTIYKLRIYIENKEVINGNLDIFINYVHSLSYIVSIKEEIDYAISPNFTINDNASSKLKSIRREIEKIDVEIHTKLNSYLKNNASSLQDNFIASRNNHYLLPVKASNKNDIKGIVYDVSASKETYFIEPYSIIELNYKLDSLRQEEELEIARIIKELCLLINRYNDELSTNNDILKEISFMISKGRFELENNYVVASLTDDQNISLLQATHPFIDPRLAIANDINLGHGLNKILVISGPNAGGKTVILKTVGLIVLMNQSGLPIPCKEASLGVFENIFLDIGEDQSIEESLSGFSYSMKRIVDITNNLDNRSLVLLDELGSKTDPSDGQALAKAIINYIHKNAATALITTHYIGVKDYAENEDYLTLASMGFNSQNYTPTYKLILNSVGSSFALEISSRLGLNEQIIKEAYKYKDSRSDTIDSIIKELNKTLELNKKQEQEIENIKKELDDRLQIITKKEEQINKRMQSLDDEIAEAKQEAIDEAINKINEIYQDFKEKSDGEIKIHLKNEAINKLNELSNETDAEETLNNEEILLNDTVIIRSLNKKGIVIAINKTSAKVSTKTGVISISLQELSKTTPDKIEKSKVKVYNGNSSTVLPSINLVGMHVDDALIELRSYLDGALFSHYDQVKIIHGHGTGTLRSAIHEYLRKCKFVKRYEIANYNDGGTGATIVYFK